MEAGTPVPLRSVGMNALNRWAALLAVVALCACGESSSDETTDETTSGAGGARSDAGSGGTPKQDSGSGGVTGSGGKAGSGGATGSGGAIGIGGAAGSGGTVDGGMIDAGTTVGNLSIEVAQRSGVAGYPIGVFGTGFGATQGSATITIGGSAAPVRAWSDTLIEATVPTVADQATQIVVTVGGNTVAWPFEVYTVAPAFSAQPARLENLIRGRQVVITGTYTDYGSGNPPCDGGKNTAPYFLSYNSCDGAFLPVVPFTVAMPLGQAVTGDVWFNMFGDSAGYPDMEVSGARFPANDYVLEASSDTTTGTNGTWTQVLSITGNKYWSRIHKVTLAGAT